MDGTIFARMSLRIVTTDFMECVQTTHSKDRFVLDSGKLTDVGNIVPADSVLIKRVKPQAAKIGREKPNTRQDSNPGSLVCKARYATPTN